MKSTTRSARAAKTSETVRGGRGEREHGVCNSMLEGTEWTPEETIWGDTGEGGADGGCKVKIVPQGDGGWGSK